MRERGKRSAGAGRGWLIVAAAAVVLVGVGAWPSAEATSSRASQLDTKLRAGEPEHVKSMAIDELRKIDSTEARNKLKDLADCADDRTAMLAMRALGRANFSGARAKLESVYEDMRRSDSARSTALIVWCQLEAARGRSWADCKHWVKSRAGSDALLRDQFAASKAKIWPNEANEE